MKITFIGAGSTVFARNVIGDCILTPELGAFDVCLFDIDPVRLDESYRKPAREAIAACCPRLILCCIFRLL